MYLFKVVRVLELNSSTERLRASCGKQANFGVWLKHSQLVAECSVFYGTSRTSTLLARSCFSSAFSSGEILTASGAKLQARNPWTELRTPNFKSSVIISLTLRLHSPVCWHRGETPADSWRIVGEGFGLSDLPELIRSDLFSDRDHCSTVNARGFEPNNPSVCVQPGPCSTRH